MRRTSARATQPASNCSMASVISNPCMRKTDVARALLRGPLQARVSSVAELGEQFRALAAEAVDEMRKGGELHVTGPVVAHALSSWPSR